MRTFISALLLITTMLTGCTVQVTKPTITGPDFSAQAPQKACKRVTSASSYGNNGTGTFSTTETETCRWFDAKGRECISRTTWDTTWETRTDRKNGKMTKPSRQQSTDSSCR